VEAISWRVRSGVDLSRIHITVDGNPYRTLAGSSRKATVSLVGLGRRAVVVKVVGVARSGRRYSHAFTFHTCVPSIGGGGGSGVPALGPS
jgi:hypothetical protein